MNELENGLPKQITYLFFKLAIIVPRNESFTVLMCAAFLVTLWWPLKVTSSRSVFSCAVNVFSGASVVGVDFIFSSSARQRSTFI